MNRSMIRSALDTVICVEVFVHGDLEERRASLTMNSVSRVIRNLAGQHTG